MTVSASPFEIFPAIPGVNIRGRKTQIVVKVADTIAFPTSEVPPEADSSFGFPSSSHLNMFSITIIALDKSIPTPRASPPIVIMLRV